ncbi:MAG: 3'-5' exonuclease [Patescibacteria group bacterium]
MSTRLDNLKDAPLAFTDLETTGDVFGVNEIIEIGLVVADQNSLEVIDELNVKIKPLYIENVVPAALAKNGYKQDDWQGAISLQEGIEQYAQKTAGSIFFAYNATFDWGFMNEAFRQTGVEDKMDYHRFDVMSIAFIKLKDKGPKKWRLSEIAKYLGIPEEPLPHRALNGARTALAVYQKLLEI